MKKVSYRTNLHCEGCISKVKPFFDEDESIYSWKVDLTNQGLLTVEGYQVSKNHINTLLLRAGYRINNTSFFWKDMEKWQRALFNTLNCLVGCSIGDFGMIFYLQAFYPETTMWLQMLLAIIAGLITSIALETSLLRARENFSWKQALQTAFGMSFISMVAMELAMTSTDFMFTGGRADFDSLSYWLALIPALIAGYLTPLPYNYYRLKKLNQSCH